MPSPRRAVQRWSRVCFGLVSAVAVATLAVMVEAPSATRATGPVGALRLVEGRVPGSLLNVSDPYISPDSDDGSEYIDLTSRLANFAGGAFTGFCVSINGLVSWGASEHACGYAFDAPVGVLASGISRPVLAAFAVDQWSKWDKVLGSNDARTPGSMRTVLVQMGQVTAVTAGGDTAGGLNRHACAVTITGSVFCWGHNGYGELGADALVQQLTPVQVVAGEGPADGDGFLTGVVSVTAGGRHTCALTSAGNVLCWGRGNSGQLGNDSTSGSQPTPVLVHGSGSAEVLSQVVSLNSNLNHTCAVTATGGVLCWGLNSSGQLGDGGTVNRSTPVEVVGVGGTGTLSAVSSVSVGATHSCAVTTSGSVLCWGSQLEGRLGNGLTTSSTVLSPVQVTAGVGPSDAGALSQVVSVASTWFNSCAVTATGAVFCWGNGQMGRNGNGVTALNQGTPVQVRNVDNAATLSGVSALASGASHMCAVQTGGSAVCWGDGSAGQRGDSSSVTTQSWPVQVLAGAGTADNAGKLSDVVAMTAGNGFSCGLTSAGSVLCWGSGGNGALGDGDTRATMTPVVTRPGQAPAVARSSRHAEGSELAVPSASLQTGDCVRFVDTGTSLDVAGNLQIARVEAGAAVVNIAGHDPGVAPMDGHLLYSDCVGVPSTISVATDVLINGRRSVIVTWYRMPTYRGSTASPEANTFQVVLIERGSGDFDVEYNFGSMNDGTGVGYWSGGADRVPVGWSGYDTGGAVAVDSHELFETREASTLFGTGAGALVSNSLNSHVAGRYVVPFRSGSALSAAWVTPAMDGSATFAGGFLPGGAPTGVTATASTTSATVSWTPGDDGIADTTGYLVTVSPDAAPCSVLVPATTCVVSGLSSSTEYTFSVVAITSAGPSAHATVSATTASLPSNVPVPDALSVADSLTDAPTATTPVATTPVTTGPPVPTPSAPVVPESESVFAPSIGDVLALPFARLLDIASVSVGGSVQVTIGGFDPGSTVWLIVASDPQVLGTEVADAAGSVTVRGVIPVGLAPGEHTLAVMDSAGTGLRQVIMVTGSILPVTGSGAVWWPILIIVFGSLLLIAQRLSNRTGRSILRDDMDDAVFP